MNEVVIAQAAQYTGLGTAAMPRHVAVSTHSSAGTAQYTRAGHPNWSADPASTSSPAAATRTRSTVIALKGVRSDSS
ncbi:hypothetical protein ACQPZF_16935 [Actinosynnema sp. CS-041913]|uniref:hypothetical protein n=1 Tax=Actinosynnema sp. CS-041913 TaxID=3239917 RepID=UPI003D8B0D8D